MAVPKHRTSKARKRKRRSHLHLNPLHLIDCTQCATKKLPHIVCKNCGYYKKQEIIKLKK